MVAVFINDTIYTQLHKVIIVYTLYLFSSAEPTKCFHIGLLSLISPIEVVKLQVEYLDTSLFIRVFNLSIDRTIIFSPLLFFSRNTTDGWNDGIVYCVQYDRLSKQVTALRQVWETAPRAAIFTARCTIVQSAVLRSHVVRPSVRLSVCLSVTLVDQDHIHWKSRKLIARSSSPTPSLFVAQRISTYSEGNMGKFGGD